ncbi:hypothetical protein Pmar_PMAR028749 [Perkinsus marinus ATCC 50983]|uniref:Uncharacterized protein n=1 Tax=Perkinsus marinus (strain ATCC 50983 / TXsc) TaxID=423536 RepID=C5LUJ7_PERM5|nr:hypothetical protein Pmar_PMAR028749 [Perkinsus marinus ATCC 50983]EEQ99593.1 hypothetical protein Pmar_PMAR028749 [Perkinsus marinus ATCC 50983]|eukprot:XP_002766876.1 hypothetical protein Pmar_PMAR028749 [Perkinsus marinus ATCC 50983]
MMMKYSRYGILHDVVLPEQLNDHQSEEPHAEEQTKQKDQMNGSPSQHQKLDLGRIIGLAPWGAQMLRALKWKPEIKDLPFPYPSDMNIDEELEKDSYDCEAFQTLRLGSHTNHSKEVGVYQYSSSDDA